MGVAGPNIEPRQYNLAKMHNFYRSTNDVIRTLFYLHWFQIYKNLPEDSIPGAPVFFAYIYVYIYCVNFDNLSQGLINDLTDDLYSTS